MRKNVAGQTVGAQMVFRSDGTDFTGGSPIERVLCYVIGDGVDQGLGQGTSPSGECFHAGRGWFVYSPTQGETNYENVVYQFYEPSAGLTVGVQIYPRVMTLTEEQNIAAGAKSMTRFTVASGATTTQIPTDIAETTPEHFKDKVMNFTTGVLAGQTVQISSYLNGGVFVVTAATDAPDQGDEGVIS